MRILHIFDHSLPLHSGYTFRSAAILREQRALGWETFHLTSPKQGKTAVEFEDTDGLRFHRCPVPPSGPPVINEWRQMRAIEARLEGLARDIKPDILHAHSPVLNAIPALRVGRRLGIPVVYEIRAFWEDAAVDHGTTREGSVRYRLTRALETWALRRVDHAFTICEGLRKDIVSRGIAPDKVTVIPNAVDIEGFQLSGEPDAELKRRLGLDGATVIGFIGSFYAYEGLDLLLDAFPAMLAKRLELRILLVGGGPLDANLKAQAQRLGIADKVVFTGRVPHGEVSRYYDLIDLLSASSMRLTELVTPLKPLEAAQGAFPRMSVATGTGARRRNRPALQAGDAGALARNVASDTWPAVPPAAITSRCATATAYRSHL
jgi:PEP-CTERM/exosortase A-associated glycosyltransferase